MILHKKQSKNVGSGLENHNDEICQNVIRSFSATFQEVIPEVARNISPSFTLDYRSMWDLSYFVLGSKIDAPVQYDTPGLPNETIKLQEERKETSQQYFMILPQICQQNQYYYLSSL